MRENQRFSVYKEVCFGLQPDAARRVVPALLQDAASAGQAAEGMGQAIKPEGQQKKDGKTGWHWPSARCPSDWSPIGTLSAHLSGTIRNHLTAKRRVNAACDSGSAGGVHAPVFRNFGTGVARSRKASGIRDPSRGRRYSRNASVISVPLSAMNSSSSTRVFPATASSSSNS